jgi:hypothetical protein
MHSAASNIDFGQRCPHAAPRQTDIEGGRQSSPRPAAMVCPAHPKPFVWTKSAGEILEKVARAKQALESV